MTMLTTAWWIIGILLSRGEILQAPESNNDGGKMDWESH
jgi:hypothetical protein